MATVSIERPHRLDPAAVGQVLQISCGMMFSAALQTATRLGVPDQLSNGPVAVKDLAASTEPMKTLSIASCVPCAARHFR